MTRAAATMQILNVGSGSRPHQDWTNLDLMGPIRLAIESHRGSVAPNFVRHRLPKPLPFDAGSFDAIYCSQVIEHFDRRDGAAILTEFRRVLRPGGIARIVVPDFEVQCRLYLSLIDRGMDLNNSSDREEYEFSKLWLIDQFARTAPGGEWSSFVGRVRDEALREKFRLSRSRPSRFSDGLNGVLPKFFNALRVAKNGELHRWAYDRLDLSDASVRVGFSRCELRSFDSSEVHAFIDFDQDFKGELQPGSIYIEMIR